LRRRAAVACGVYVALRKPQLERLGLDALDGRIRPWVGAGLILSSSLLLVHAITYIRSQFSARLTGAPLNLADIRLSLSFLHSLRKSRLVLIRFLLLVGALRAEA
jgi:hypothetical protein